MRSVQLYARQCDDLEPRDLNSRLGVLLDFAEFVERTPDQMVEEIYDMKTRKYRKRGFYTDRIREFSARDGGPERTQLARGNVIRSFFIANGRRIVPERPGWL